MFHVLGDDRLTVFFSGEYKHNPFTLEDHNLPKGSRFYDVSRGVSTAELGHSGSSNGDNGLPPLKSQSVQQSTEALSNLPSQPPPAVAALQPAFELDGDKAKSYAELGKRWDKSMRPLYQQQRVSSWSDTRSAWNDEGYWMGGKGKKRCKEKARPRLGRAQTALDRTREEDVEVEVDIDANEGEGGEGSGIIEERQVESDQEGWRRVKMLGVRRYHLIRSVIGR